MTDIDTANTRLDARQRRHDRLSARLASLGDDELTTLLAGAPAWRNHIHGNQSGVIQSEGDKVFVKKIALTDVEQAAGPGATANHFGLPTFYQYGVGSAGFGAWRELSAYLQASDWALSGACPYFPLLHHWRVESRASRPPLRPEQLDWLEKAPAYWDGSDAVRARLDAIAAAPASLVLFLEHVPETLDAWMARRLEAGLDPALEARALSLHNQVQEAAAFMNAQGMLHFDLHAFNVLTDGEQSYVADFGLALCAGFQLSADERAFFETHRLYDRCFAAWDFAERLTARTAAPAALPSEMRAMVERHTALTGVFGRFFRGLTDGRKSGPYPAAELEAAFAALT